MLADRYHSDVDSLILPAETCRPFPTVDERGAWDALKGDLRERALTAGERLLDWQLPSLPATLYMDFARTGNRKRYEDPYFARRSALSSLVIAECVEGKGRFADDIVNGLWAICEESSWVIPAHSMGFGGDEPLPESADHYIDLFAADTGALLAWTQYLLGSSLDKVSSRICARISREVKERILLPFLTRDDFWWMGRGDRWRLNNWSPWCTCSSLTCFLLLEPDPKRGAEAVRKGLAIVDRWLAQYSPDGGCDEGPSYWTVAAGALFDLLDLLYRFSQGRIDVYGADLIREMGRYIHRVHISGDYYVPFADAPAKLHVPPGLLYRYGRRTKDEDLAALGAWALQRYGVGSLLGGKLTRVLPDIFDADGIENPADPPYVRDVWLPGIQVMAAREREGSDRGFYLAAKGGHNNESHNHNDVGSFVVYYDGQPVLVDVGVGTYTAKTFSDNRYDIWTMQSAYHNLPAVNGVQQKDGKEFSAQDTAYRTDDEQAEFALDIAGAYPAQAGIESWRRKCLLRRTPEPSVRITDSLVLAAPTADITLSLVTPLEPRAEPSGSIALDLPEGGGIVLTYDSASLQVAVEAIQMDDARLTASWGEHLFRILLKPRNAVREAEWHLTLAAG